MTNPYADAARGLAERLKEIGAEKQAAVEAAEAKRLTEKQTYERALDLFATVLAHVEACVTQANQALDGTGASLSTTIQHLQPSNAGSIKIALLGTGAREPSFRIVGNSSFSVFVHELEKPKYGPFDLNDAAALPYEEMIKQFIETASRTLTSGITGAKTV